MRKVIARRIRRSRGGAQVAADLDAVVAANVGRTGAVHASSRHARRTVQRSRRRNGRVPGAPHGRAT